MMPDVGDCEVCGKPGTTIIQDVIAVNQPGKPHRVRADGNPHVFCNEHKRPYRRRVGNEIQEATPIQ